MAQNTCAWIWLGSLSVYAITTLTLLILYSNYELENHIVIDHNNGPAVIATNVLILLATIILIRLVLHEIYSSHISNSNYPVILGTMASATGSAIIISSYVSLGYNCHYSLPCVTIISPLYAHALIYASVMSLIIVVDVIAGLLLGFNFLCRCQDLCNKATDQEEDLDTNIHLSYDSVQKLHTNKLDQCAICKTTYNTDSQLKMISSCGHHFHKDCMTADNNNCPVCQIVEK